MRNSALILGLSIVSLPLFSQQQETKKEVPARVKVQIIEEINGDRIVEEKNYEVGSLSPARQRVYLDSLLESVTKAEKGNNRRVTITLEEGKSIEPEKNSEKYTEFRFDNEFESPERENNKRSSRKDSWEREADRLASRIDAGVARGMAEMEGKMSRLWADADIRPAGIGADIQRSLKGMRVFSDDPGFFNGSKTVRALSVEPNRPFDGTFNLKFSTKAKGDVQITVTDTKGKEQARKNLKDFDGEFVGQIELKNSSAGTYFFKVVQNDDGVVQRVVVP